MSGPRSDRIAGGMLVALGAAIGVEATTFEVAFLTDPVGPKALPLLAAAILVAAGAHALARPSVSPSWPGRSLALRMGAAAAAFLVYALVLPWLGFFVSTTVVVATLSGLYGAPLLRGTAAAMALAGALWLLFVNLLALPLPVGDLWMR